MQTFVRRCLGLSIALEIIVIVCVLGQVQGFPGTRWAILGVLLAVGTFATFSWVNRFWDSMGSAEKTLVLVPAVGPLVPVTIALATAVILMAIIVIATIAIIGLIAFFAGHGAGGYSVPKRGYGSWVGDERVIYNSDGRPAWIGNDRVVTGSSGGPSWIGDKRVINGSDGRPAWIGNDHVIHKANGEIDWIGDHKVQ